MHAGVVNVQFSRNSFVCSPKYWTWVSSFSLTFRPQGFVAPWTSPAWYTYALNLAIKALVALIDICALNVQVIFAPTTTPLDLFVSWSMCEQRRNNAEYVLMVEVFDESVYSAFFRLMGTVRGDGRRDRGIFCRY